MKSQKENFLRNEFLTMSVLGAMGRSKTYLESATEGDKKLFRKGLREELDHVSRRYSCTVKEQEHFANIKELSYRLSDQFSHCLRAGRFRIGIAQKALNLYLKYLWCIDLIPIPPHCPFDSIVISYLSNCNDLSWTSVDTIEDYKKLVAAGRKKADWEPLAKWELEVWTKSVQATREPAKTNASTPRNQAG